MSDATTVRNLLNKYETELASLMRDKDDIANKISALAIKIDAFRTTLRELESEGATTGELKLQLQEESSGREDSRGMTASALEILHEVRRALTVEEIRAALEAKGFKPKKVNVYIMLKRLKTSEKITMIEKEGEPKRYRFRYQQEDRLIV